MRPRTNAQSRRRRSASGQYDVFLSYNQAADHDLAEAIQRGLERFAKPWNQRRALRVFRDNSAMGVSPELWPAIVDSLDRSDWLVVLASPGARRSKWVNREIRRWFESERATPANRLLLVLTDGLLVWDEDRSRFDPARSTALPDAIPDELYAGEPRYLDMRWYRTISGPERAPNLDLRHARFRSAIAEIAAPVHGVAKDDLDGEAVRLERRARQLRRAVIAGLAALSIAASVLAVVATVNADRARRALAVSEARRFLLGSRVSTTEQEAIRAAEGAWERAREAEVHDESFLDGLFAALTRDDLPLATFAGLGEPDSYTGGNRGISFSRDGSTFAFVGTDDAVHVIDVWNLFERHIVALDDVLGEHERASPFIQTSFGDDDTTLVVVTSAEIVVVELAAESSVRHRFRLSAAVEPLAASVSPGAAHVGVLDRDMVFTVYDLRTGGVAGRFGVETLVADADLVRVAISADQNRMCAVGGGVVRSAQLDPPALLIDVAVEATGVMGCWPEGCEGTLEAVVAVVDQQRDAAFGDDVGELVCVARDGVTAGLASPPASGLALSRVPPPEASTIDLGQGATLDTLAGITATGAVLALPHGQEWFAARVLMHASGPVLVDYRPDGDIPVWRLARGLLPPADAIARTSPRPGRGHHVLPPPDAVEPVAFFEDHTDDGSTISFSRLAPARRTVDIPRRGEPLLIRSTSASDVLTVFSDGSAVWADLASESDPVDWPLPLRGDVRAAAHEQGVLAVASGDRVVAFDVGRAAEPQEPVLATDSLGAPVCAVDVSPGGTALGVALCPERGPGTVHTIDVATGDPILQPLDLRYSFPSSVAVTDDGGTVVVAFIAGQIGVRLGDDWVEPPSLSVGKSDHNDFQRGWAEVDPSGEFMITRRNGDGLELWRVAASDDAPVARLTQHEFSAFLDPPDRVIFDDREVAVTWSNRTSSGYVRYAWPMTADGLAATACLLLEGSASCANDPRG